MPQHKASAEPATDENLSKPAQEADNAEPNNNVETDVDEQLEEQGASEVEEALVEQSEADELRARLQEATDEAAQSRDLALRTRAEMENLRKRQSRELENAHKYALDKISMELLPVRDTLEMGVAAAHADEAEMSRIVEGTELTLKMLTQAMEKFNVVEVDPIDEKFDPDLHQAISVQEGTDKPANTVLVVMQKGYTLNDRLLRPAMVVIAK